MKHPFQAEKQPHFVHIKCIPPGGRYQVVLLWPEAWGSPDEDMMMYHGSRALGPFLVDVVNMKLAEFRNFTYRIEELRGWQDMGSYLTRWWRWCEPIGLDNPVEHLFAEGQLEDFCGYDVLSRWDVEHDPPSRPGLWSVDTSITLNVDADGNFLDYLDVYNLGSDTLRHRYEGGLRTVARIKWLQGSFVRGEYDAPAGATTVTERQWSEGPNGPALIINLSLTAHLPPAEFPVTLETEFITIRETICRNDDDPITIERPYQIVPITNVISTEAVYEKDTLARVENAVYDVHRTVHTLHEDARPLWGDFRSCRKCIEAFQLLSINGIAFVRDLPSLLKTLTPTFQVLKNPKSIKNWSNLILSWWYGTRLTWSDMQAILLAFRQIRKVGNSVTKWMKFRDALHTRYGTITDPIKHKAFQEGGTCRFNSRVCARLEIPTEATQVGKLKALLSDMDMRLTLVNVWDLLPYSFVVNWFANVGKLLSEIDYTIECDKLAVREWVHSAHSKAIPLKNTYYKHGFMFRKLNIDTYERRVSTILPYPPLQLGAPSFLRHWWEATLLVLQRRK